MNTFPITLDIIRAYEKEIADGLEERISERLQAYIKTNPSYILDELRKKVECNVRMKRMEKDYVVYLGSYDTLLQSYAVEDVEKTIKKYFVNPLIEHYFPGAEVKFSALHQIILVWKL
jgi:hypothetical protein